MELSYSGYLIEVQLVNGGSNSNSAFGVSNGKIVLHTGKQNVAFDGKLF